jgi:hypothetical protein
MLMKSETHCNKSNCTCPHKIHMECGDHPTSIHLELDCKNLAQQDPLNVDVASFLRFVREMQLPDIFAELPDKRRQSQITYPMSSLSMMAFYTCAFRQGSKNAMQTSIESVQSQETLEGIIQMLNFEGTTVPHMSVVDDALDKVEAEDVNEILFKLFDTMVKKKIFYNHQHKLLPYNTFQIGVDGYWVHTYDHPHSTDANGNNNCPYCLARIHNKGKPNEYTQYVHVMITFVLICEGITLPLYVYTLKSNQIEVSDCADKFKEECELKAAHAVLPLIRKRYPRLSFTFLGDALYANKPFIRLCKQLNMDYIIVLKDTTLKNLGKRCNELAKTELYQKHYCSEEKTQQGKSTLIKKAAWFNEAEVGDDVFTNVLRFEEILLHKDGSQETLYKGAWICSKKIFRNNCFKMAKRGRSRWGHEDLHNTLKNRGFDIRHDMARTRPNLMLVWKLMMFIAFFLFELFACTTLAKTLKKSRSLMKFAKDMLQQLIEKTWKIIANSPIWKKQRVQFRYAFCGDP